MEKIDPTATSRRKDNREARKGDEYKRRDNGWIQLHGASNRSNGTWLDVDVFQAEFLGQFETV